MTHRHEPDPHSAQKRAAASSMRRLLVVARMADVLAWPAGLALSRLVTRDFRLQSLDGSLVVVALVATLIQLLAIAATNRRRRHRDGSLGDARSAATVALVTGVIVTVPAFLSPIGLGLWWPEALGSRGVALGAVPFVILIMGTARTLPRIMRDRALHRIGGSSRTIVFGAGDVGEHLVRRMLADRTSIYSPIALVDDDVAKRRLAIHGVPVLGSREAIPSIADTMRATTLVMAIAAADAGLVRDVADVAKASGLRLVVVPSLDEMLEGADHLADLRDVSIEDLVGRQPVDIEPGVDASYIRGRRVLVTGAGGSIGSELCQQISRLGPAELIMLDRDETALQQVQLSLSGHGLLDTPDVVLADIRDGAALTALFEKRRPDVVFHAAALKHLPMLEQYPLEAWKTNVLGTLNVLDAAVAAGVATFVNVSTDKAANPTSVLGASKRLAERLTSDFAARQPGRYLSVRFGNVLGSRGSLVPVFRSLIEAGRPLTVTHPEATRYFMTIPEACHLVLQAGGIGSPGEVLILDMGEPVRILDVAERMIAMSGRDVDIVFTGLRPGEKLHEELVGEGETDTRPVHSQISHAMVPPLSACDLDPERFLGGLAGSRAEVTV